MLIKERPIISWLMNSDSNILPNGILLAAVANPINHQLLNEHLAELNNIRINNDSVKITEVVET